MDDGKGRLVTPVGDSPENEFVYIDSADGKEKSGALSPGPTMDLAMSRPGLDGTWWRQAWAAAMLVPRQCGDHGRNRHATLGG